MVESMQFSYRDTSPSLDSRQTNSHSNTQAENHQWSKCNIFQTHSHRVADKIKLVCTSHDFLSQKKNKLLNKIFL